MQTVPVLGCEEFLGLGDGRDEGVVCIVGTLLPAFKMVLIRLAKIDCIFVGIHIWSFRNLKDGLVNGFPFFQSHRLSYSIPHGLFPGQEILLHGTSAIIAFTSGSKALGTKF